MPRFTEGREDAIVCPRCEEQLDVQSGGWAYVHTQVLLHLDRCADELSEHDRQELARSLMPDGRA
jgi:phage pi2 protein 07